MARENAIRESYEQYDEGLDFDELERKLEEDLNSQLSDLDFLVKDKEKIGDPESLGNTVMNVVWEQFLNQVAITAGEDFIRENRGLTLDLRNEAHIQTTEDFANGKIASHNSKIDYQQRYDDWQSNFQRDENGNIKTKWDSRSGKYKNVLKKDARKDFDKGRPTGKNSNNTNMDHTISAAEIIRDPAANAHLTREEQVAFANSEKNLSLMDSAANQSKGDSAMSDWLDSKRDRKTPAERFDIDETELREKDKIAREEEAKRIGEGERRSIETGKQSQREEAFRITGKALRAVVMQMLAELIKDVIGKLISWIRDGQKELKSLINQISTTIQNFISNMKTHLLHAGNTLITTIATAVLGPVVSTIKKVFMLLKQGAKSIREAIEYIKAPGNSNKPIDILMFEVGKILIAGLSSAGAIVLGEVIEKGLMAIPVFAVEIPLLGSLANILGIFMSALTSGIVGALAINMIDKVVAKKQKADITKRQIAKGNEIVNTQNRLKIFKREKHNVTKREVSSSIIERHQEAGEIIRDALNNIFNEDDCFEEDYSDYNNDNQAKFDKIYQLLHER